MVAKKPKKKYRTLAESATHGRFDRDKIRQVIDSLLTKPSEVSMKDLPALIKKLPKLGKDVERFKEDMQESLALVKILDRSKKSLKENKLKPLKDVMNDIKAKAKQLKPIPKREVLQETVTGLHKIGLISTKEKDDILKGKVELGIRPLEESFDNVVDTAEAIQRGEKVKVQKGIYFASVKALRKVLGNDAKMSEKDIAALAKLAAEGKVKLPTKKGKPKGFKGRKIKGEPLSDTIIKDRR